MQLTIIEDITSTKINKYEVDDICAFLANRYEKMPANAKLYHTSVSLENDVTPTSIEDIEKLQKLKGEFFLIIYPGEVITVIQIILVLYSLYAIFFLKPPDTKTDEQVNPGPNNALTLKSNQQRLNGRIPDIFGTCVAYPDSITLPYTFFYNNLEYQVINCCVGRGAYEFDMVKDENTSVYNIREGDTLLSDMQGVFVAAWGPNKCLWNDQEMIDAQLKFGSMPFVIDRSMINTKYKCNTIEGLVLPAPNFKIDSNVNVYADGTFTLTGAGTDFTTKFDVNDFAKVTFEKLISFSGTLFVVDTNERYMRVRTASLHAFEGWSYFSNHYPFECKMYFENAIYGVYVTIYEDQNGYSWINLNSEFQNSSLGLHNFRFEKKLKFEGLAKVLTVTPSSVRFDVSNGAISNWDYIVYAGNITNQAVTFYNSNGSKAGPIYIDRPIDSVSFNLVAESGLYKSNGSDFTPIPIELVIKVQPVDQYGNPTTPAIEQHFYMQGSTKKSIFRALSPTIGVVPKSRVKVSVSRITAHDEAFNGTQYDEVKWRDLYYSSIDLGSPVTTHFGNVTTMLVITAANSEAIKTSGDKKLNVKVTRKLPRRLADGTFSTANGSSSTDIPNLYPTNKMADILCAICLDKRIGNRHINEIDVVNIYDTQNEINAYFGNDQVTNFAYSFDSPKSFEETAQIIADASYCGIYRRGNIIRLTFEHSQINSTILFNHRNKIPGSEIRTISFGNVNDNDGIEFQFINPDTNLPDTISYPNEGLMNPKKIESVGIRNRLQAYFHANRYYAKLRYQNIATEFDACDEANLLLLNDKILVSDATRPGMLDGEVTAQTGLELTLSQDVLVVSSSVIFLQYYDGTIESIPVTIGGMPNKVVLQRAPRVTLVTDPNAYARTTFLLVSNTDVYIREFLVKEKAIQNNMTCKVTALNYDERYYSHDSDFKTGKVNINGILT